MKNQPPSSRRRKQSWKWIRTLNCSGSVVIDKLDASMPDAPVAKSRDYTFHLSYESDDHVHLLDDDSLAALERVSELWVSEGRRLDDPHGPAALAGRRADSGELLKDPTLTLWRTVVISVSYSVRQVGGLQIDDDEATAVSIPPPWRARFAQKVNRAQRDSDRAGSERTAMAEVRRGSQRFDDASVVGAPTGQAELENPTNPSWRPATSTDSLPRTACPDQEQDVP